MDEDAEEIYDEMLEIMEEQQELAEEQYYDIDLTDSDVESGVLNGI